MTFELKKLCKTYRELQEYYRDKDDRIDPDESSSLEDIEYIIHDYHTKYGIKDLCSDVQLSDIRHLQNFVMDVTKELEFYIFMKDYLLDKVKYADLFRTFYEKKRRAAYNPDTMLLHQPDIMDYDWKAFEADLKRSQTKLPRYYSGGRKANQLKAKA